MLKGTPAIAALCWKIVVAVPGVGIGGVTPPVSEKLRVATSNVEGVIKVKHQSGTLLIGVIKCH